MWGMNKVNSIIRGTMLIVTKTPNYALRAVNPRADDRPAGGWSARRAYRYDPLAAP
jgi:hypothetical protein